MDARIAAGFFGGVFLLDPSRSGWLNRRVFRDSRGHHHPHSPGFLGTRVPKGRTSEAIKKLLNLQRKRPASCEYGKEIDIPVDEAAVGNLVSVWPGETFPVDGVIVEGRTSVDELMSQLRFDAGWMSCRRMLI